MAGAAHRNAVSAGKVQVRRVIHFQPTHDRSSSPDHAAARLWFYRLALRKYLC